MGSSLTNKGNQKLTYSQLPCIDCCNLSAANQQHEAIDDLKSQHLISSGSQMRVLLTAVVCFPPRCIFTALCLGSNRMEVELMMEGHGWKRGAGGWTTHCVHSVWAGKQLLIKSEERIRIQLQTKWMHRCSAGGSLYGSTPTVSQLVVNVNPFGLHHRPPAAFINSSIMFLIIPIIL